MTEAATTTPPRVDVAGSSAGRGQLLRFLVVGGSNTLVTLVLFVLLQRWLSATSAYTTVFGLGLAYTTLMTATVVFGSRLTWRTGGAFVGWYLLVYGVGLTAVAVLEALWDPSSILTSLVTVGLTAPLNFLGGRVLFAGPAAPTVTDDTPSVGRAKHVDSRPGTDDEPGDHRARPTWALMASRRTGRGASPERALN